MTRSVLFDTETTGVNPLGGDRVVEIAALELINDLPTGQHFHCYLDPQRDVPDEVVRVHGLTREFLTGKPLFKHVHQDMLAFFAHDKLIAHNAAFDFGFIDMELARIGLPPLDKDRMIDSWAMAKHRFPGMPNSLDALCRRFSIDLSERTSHNALLDCKLLAQVYVELTGGRQRGLSFASQDAGPKITVYEAVSGHIPRPITVSPAELEAHKAFMAKIDNPIWLAH